MKILQEAIRKLAAIAVLAIAVAGGAAHAQDKGTIYYLAPVLFDEFQDEAKKAIEQSLATLGYKVITLDAQNKADEQLNQLDNALTQNPAAIIMAAVDFSTVIPGIEKARAAGVPVLHFDRSVKDTQSDLTSVAGTVEIGKLAAGEIARMLTEKNGAPKGVVLEVMGDPGDAYTLDIHDGFDQVIKTYPDIQVTTKPAMAWEAGNAASIVDDQLQVNKNIDVMFLHGDHFGPPVVQVLEKNGFKAGDFKLVFAVGMPVGLDLIRQGWADVAVEQPLYAQVYGLAMFVDKLIRKEPLTAGTYDVLGLQGELTIEPWGANMKVPGRVITKTNVDDAANWGNLHAPTDPVVSVQ